MLTIEDCFALSKLTEEEIDAIAEHEHLPEIVALELGAYLVRTEGGESRVKKIIEDDIRDACARGDFVHSAKLKLALKHFCESHPNA